jgi:sterol desaturase/sphingolipid hydroxylase (fatty acid hydroxylase superfamily)
MFDSPFTSLYDSVVNFGIAYGVHFFEYLFLAGVAFLLFYVLLPKYFKKNKIQQKNATRKDFIREFFNSLRTVLIIVILSLVMLYTDLVQYTQAYFDLDEYPTWWFFLSMTTALIIHDTYFYWMHRTAHHPKLYKHIHYLHHKSVNPSPWAAYSFQLTEGILEAMITVIILLLIPIHPLALLGFGMQSLAINVYGHLGYEIFPKWFRRSPLFHLFNTSVHHNMHHSTFNYNFGLYFRVWDRLMGTEHPDYVKQYDKIQQSRFGQSSNTSDNSVKEELKQAS